MKVSVMYLSSEVIENIKKSDPTIGELLEEKIEGPEFETQLIEGINIDSESIKKEIDTIICKFDNYFRNIEKSEDKADEKTIDRHRQQYECFKELLKLIELEEKEPENPDVENKANKIHDKLESLGELPHL